jgi:hypothetical protein
VQSKIKQEMVTANALDDVRPVQGARAGSARGMRQPRVVFGRSLSGTGIGASKKPQQAVRMPLSKGALDTLNSKKTRQVEEMVEEALVNEENINSSNQLPPKTPNYGKTPKYIQKFKQEAVAKEDARLEAKAAKHRPAGTRLLPEDERIATLETLNKNKKDVTKILMQMPISMRTDGLRKQKIELENKL